MCYSCNNCNRCGKLNEDSPYYRPPAGIVCFKCGGEVDARTGLCAGCGARAFSPPGAKPKAEAEPEAAAGAGAGAEEEA